MSSLLKQLLLLARLSFVCLCLVNLNAFAGHADQVDPDLFVLVTGDNYFPFASSEAPLGGWSKAIVSAVFEKMQNDVEIDTLPWARGLQWAYVGHYRGAFPHTLTEAREKDFVYSNPINTVPMRIYVAANSPVNDITELRKKSLCLPHGYSLNPWTSQLFVQYKFSVNRAKSAEGCAKQVAKNWSDFGFINSYFDEEQLFKQFGSIKGIRLLDEPSSDVPLYFIISKNVPEAEQIIERFNRALTELEKSGEKAKIDKYFIDWMSKPTDLAEMSESKDAVVLQKAK